MKLTHRIAIATLLGFALAGCQTQSPQPSSQQPPQPPSSPSSSSPSLPSPPSVPSTSPSQPSMPSPSSPSSSSQSQSGDDRSKQSSKSDTAEESYGARPGSSNQQSEDIPDPSSEPRGDGDEAVQEELMEVLESIEEQLEKTASNPEITPEQAETIEQYEQVLADLEVQIGELDPQTQEALLEVLKDLEQTIASANETAEQQGDPSIPVTITVTEVAILQDLIEILGIPGALPGVGTPSIPVGLPSSSDETLADLDATLEASIGVFDGMILSERVSAQGKPGEFDGETEVYTGGGEDLFEEGTLGEGEGEGKAGSQQQAQTPEMPSGEQTASSQQQSQSAAGAGGGAQQKAAKIPDDIPDGRDDDIVARQIREAAMKEKDPELREKLWEEYRRYKKGK